MTTKAAEWRQPVSILVELLREFKTRISDRFHSNRAKEAVGECSEAFKLDGFDENMERDEDQE
jgi:hypothetical protein